MKKVILFFPLFLTVYFSFGQCGPYHITATSTGCSTATLSISGASAASQIYWIVIDTIITANRGLVGPVTTVAGGNGLGSAANQLNTPSMVYVDGVGNLYVSDYKNNRIQKFPPGSTSATNGVTVAGGNGQGGAANQLDFPYGIALDSAGNLYVADLSNYRVQRFPPGSTSDTNGTTVAGGNGAGYSANQFNEPTGICLDRFDNLYVTDGVSDIVEKFPPGSTSATNGITVAGDLATNGSAANQLWVPYDVRVDSSGYIYVADYANYRIQKFPPNSAADTNAITVAGGNGLGDSSNQFARPSGIFLDGSDNLYVADVSRILKFPAGSTSATHGIIVAGGNGIGSAADQFQYSTGVFVDPTGNIYVADAGNNRIQKWGQPAIIAIDTTLSVTGSGIYYAIVFDSLGCSAYTDTVTIINHGSTISQSICSGTTYSFNGHNLSTAGTYADTLIGAGMFGCDSTISLTLTIYSATTGSTAQSICQGMSYTTGTHTYTSAGVYLDTLVGASMNGCDSIISLSLSYYPPATGSTIQAICPGSSYTLGLNSYSMTGIYSDTLLGAAMYGCDSIVTLELGVLDSTTAYFYLQPSDTAHVWYIILPYVGGVSYLWQWGDSTSSAGDTVSHTYDSVGYYNICLTVTDSAGCSATYCDTSVYLYKNQSGQMIYVVVLPQYPAGINNMSTQNMNINYYAGSVHFSEALQAPTQLKLYDLSGRVVMQQDNFSGTMWNINNEIAQGVYIIQLQNENYSLSKKLMIIQY